MSKRSPRLTLFESVTQRDHVFVPLMSMDGAVGIGGITRYSRAIPGTYTPGINTWGGTGQGKWPWNIKLDGPQAAGARWHELNSPQHTRRWVCVEDAVALGLGVADGVIVSDAVEVPVDVRMAVDEGVGVGGCSRLCWTSNNGAFSIVLAFESWWD